MSGAHPITVEVVRNAIVAYADEMAIALSKAAYNMMIYEVRDYCCGLIDTQARMISQNRGGLPIFLADLGVGDDRRVLVGDVEIAALDVQAIESREPARPMRAGQLGIDLLQAQDIGVKAKEHRAQDGDALELAAIAPGVAAAALCLPLIELRDPDVGHNADLAQLFLWTVGNVG